MEAILDFEKPIVNLERKLQDLRELARQEGVDFGSEIQVLEKKVSQLIEETFAKLTPWQRVQLSRHPNRPYTRDYVDLLFPTFRELQGDRRFGDDQSILAGIADWPPVKPGESKEDAAKASRFPCIILGHQKGRTTKQKVERNFGMAKPEGYRKAMRLMDLAERMRLPIITFIDTPGAYPGPDAEERGQAQAIAESIARMFDLTVPVIAVVIGEGGSGGALALGVADKVLMQEFSVYSVISPESCAAILYSDASQAESASTKLKMTPTDLERLKVIDGIVSEPKGGAHRDWNQSAELLRERLTREFEPLIASVLGDRAQTQPEELRAERARKFEAMGSIGFQESTSPLPPLEGPGGSA
jgi:acetyl-CoA carboxylase carboxyl transferase subunit alpha